MVEAVDPAEIAALSSALARARDRGAAPLDPAVLVGAAATAVRTRSFEAAVDLLTLALAADPQSPRAWALLGAAHEGLAHDDEAERAYEEATSRDDDDLVSALALAGLQARRGKHAPARALAEYVLLRARAGSTLKSDAERLLSTLPNEAAP